MLQYNNSITDVRVYRNPSERKKFIEKFKEKAKGLVDNAYIIISPDINSKKWQSILFYFFWHF